MRQRRFLLRSVALFLTLLCLSGATLGCARAEEDDTLRVVCTTFAAYDWCREIAGDREGIEVSLLIDDGSDLHSYQPTVADKVRLLSSDLVVYVGGESDAWVLDMLEDRERAFCLGEVEGVVLRRVHVEHDDEHEHEAEHVHEHTEGDGHSHAAFDEHLWLSPDNARLCTAALAARIASLDEAGREEYEANAARYGQELAALDATFSEVVANARTDTLLVADRFPFVYLAEEYGLTYCAAFEGCTTENEASFDTIVRLSAQADEWQSRYLLVTESANTRLAQSVIASSSQKEMAVLSMHSMQAVSAKQLFDGVTYLSVMYQNADVLRKVLS